MSTPTTYTFVIDSEVRRCIIAEYRLDDTARESKQGGVEYAVLRISTHYDPKRPAYLSGVSRLVSGEHGETSVNDAQPEAPMANRITPTSEYSAQGLENAYGNYLSDHILDVDDAIEWARGALD